MEGVENNDSSAEVGMPANPLDYTGADLSISNVFSVVEEENEGNENKKVDSQDGQDDWNTPIEEELDAVLGSSQDANKQQITTPLTVTRHMDLITSIPENAKKELPLSLLTLLDTNKPLSMLKKESSTSYFDQLMQLPKETLARMLLFAQSDEELYEENAQMLQQQNSLLSAEVEAANV